MMSASLFHFEVTTEQQPLSVWENYSMRRWAVRLQRGSHSLQPCEVSPAFLTQHHSLSLCTRKMSQETQFNSITVLSSIAVSFPPLYPPHSDLRVVVLSSVCLPSSVPLVGREPPISRVEAKACRSFQEVRRPSVGGERTGLAARIAVGIHHVLVALFHLLHVNTRTCLCCAETNGFLNSSYCKITAPTYIPAAVSVSSSVHPGTQIVQFPLVLV